MFCGKCGAQIPDGYEFCMKCGTKVDMTQEQEQDKQPKKKKWFILAIVIVCAIAAAAGVMNFVNVSKDKSGLYNHIAWGTSFDEVKKIAEKNSGKENVSTAQDNSALLYEEIDDYGADEGITALIVYDCKEDNTLHEIDLFVTDELHKYTGSQFYDKFKSEFTKLYGNSEGSSLRDTWLTKKSKISIMNLDEMLIISYADLNTVEK